MKSDCEEQKIEAIKIKQKKERMFNHIAEKTKEESTDNEIQNILEGVEKRDTLTKEKIKDQIEHQHRSFQQKLMRRKSRALTAKSLSYCGGFGESETSESLCNE